MLKKLPLFIFACIAFISFLAFPFKSFASGNSFTASNISFDPTTSHISFDMSNLPSGWNTATTYVYMDIWSSDHSTLYYADSVALESSCNNSTHCDYTFGLTPNSYTAGAPVQIVLWITDGPHFDYGTYLISQPFVLSDYYVTPTPTPTATP